MNASSSSSSSARRNAPAFDVEAVRREFPILDTMAQGKKLVFLDSGASAQKPRVVIDAISRVYETGYANIHRGVYQLSQMATEAYEGARTKVQHFIKAASPAEIVFTKGATEAINLVASSYGARFLKAGDEVVLSVLEHHANIVPWQLLRERLGIVIRVVPVDESGAFMMDEYERLLNARTKFVAVTQASNALGTMPPIAEIVRMAHGVGAAVLIDGAQGIVHETVDVKALDCDFYVFSGHKLYGPGGIGVLYGKERLLAAMPPYQGGGDMILSVSFEKTEYAPPPARFEAGTPPIADAIGLGVAIDFLSGLDRVAIAAHEAALLDAATARLSAIKGVKIYGTARPKAAILSFTLDGVHPHDIGTILDHDGIAVRVGHHCAQPVMERFGIPGTVRASFGLYNTMDEVEVLARGLEKVREIFG